MEISRQKDEDKGCLAMRASQYNWWLMFIRCEPAELAGGDGDGGDSASRGARNITGPIPTYYTPLLDSSSDLLVCQLS